MNEDISHGNLEVSRYPIMSVCSGQSHTKYANNNMLCRFLPDMHTKRVWPGSLGASWANGSTLLTFCFKLRICHALLGVLEYMGMWPSDMATIDMSHAHVYTRFAPPPYWTRAMEAVKKAASGAVDTIRNSPLFRRKFGTQNRADSEEEPRPLSPERDKTPFVQGINFQVHRHIWLLPCVN